MKVRNIMKGPVFSVDPEASIADAARLMGERDVGVVPVVEADKIVGIITDRDIAIRAVARGLATESPIRGVMTTNVVTCRAEEELDDLFERMANNQVRRLPVTDQDGGLIGIVSIGDAARLDWDKREVAETLSGICHPQGPHCQKLATA
jgi:CBS domain-containing protein